MAGNRKMKRQNYIAKNSLQAISLLILFVAILIKWVFMNHKMASGLSVYLTVVVFLLSITGILSMMLREVVCKAVAYRKSRGQYKNALRIMKTAVFVGFAIGVFIFLIFVIFAGKLTNIMFSLGSYGTFPMIVFAVSVPFLFLSAVLMGSFDGFDFSMPDGASKIIFAITDLLFSIILIIIACNMGEKHGNLLHDTRVIDVFGATGAAAGFSIACMIASLWLLVLFKAFRRKMRNSISEDTSRSQENFAEQVIGLGTACGTPIARYLALLGPVLLNQILFFKFFQWPIHFSSVSPGPSNVYMQYVLNAFWILPILGVLELLGKYSEDYLHKTMKKDDIYHCGMRIILNTKQYLCGILPAICVIGVCLSSLQNAFWKTASIQGWLISLTIALFGLAFLGASMLKGLGKEWIGIIAGLAGFLAQTIAAVFLFSQNCYTAEQLVYTNLIYSLVFLIGCVIGIYRYCVYKKHLVNHLAMPMVATFAAVITAVLCMFLKTVIGDIPAIIIAMVASMFIHMLTLMVTGCVKENELSEYPQGILMAPLGRLIGIYS